MTDGAELGVSQSRSQVPHQSPRRVAHRLRTNPAPRGLSHGCFQQLGSSMRSKLPISSKCSKQQCYRWRNRVFGSHRVFVRNAARKNPRSRFPAVWQPPHSLLGFFRTKPQVTNFRDCGAAPPIVSELPKARFCNTSNRIRGTRESESPLRCSSPKPQLQTSPKRAPMLYYTYSNE